MSSDAICGAKRSHLHDDGSYGCAGIVPQDKTDETF